MTAPFDLPRVPGERSQSPGNAWQKAGLLTIGSSTNNTLAERQGRICQDIVSRLLTV
ncbi:MAG: hypothetical protein NZ837_02640 [Gammaproteobacteria bacterium]|nr:hypothetical protein [Gammaproteobacteria bacterium]